MAHARYQERKIGVLDRVTMEIVMPGSAGWARYQNHLAKSGEQPDPMPDAPKASLAARRREMAARVNGERNIAEKAAKATAVGYVWDANPKALANLTAVLALRGPVARGFTWRTADNLDIDVFPDLLPEIAEAVIARMDAIYRYSWALKDQIAASNEPETVDITSGWPNGQ